MTEFSLLHRRSDGTFVIALGGLPYHVIEGDPLFSDVSAAAEGVELPPEPGPQAPPAPPPPPLTLTARQFLIGLASAGFITPAEALAAATVGTVPAAIDAVFGQMAPADALAARITWAKMTTVSRNHPLVEAAAAAAGRTADDIDLFFAQAVQIP